MHHERCDEEYELALINSYRNKARACGYEVFSNCFSPPSRQSYTRKNEKLPHWADYEDYDYLNSTNVPHHRWQIDEANTALRGTMYTWIGEQVAAKRVGVIVGISNGAIVASDFAIWVKERLGKQHPVLLMLLSGLPADQQIHGLSQIYNRWSPGHVKMTIGSREKFWVNKQYPLADKLFADVKTFDGGHARESKELMEKLGKSAAKQICSLAS